MRYIQCSLLEGYLTRKGSLLKRHSLFSPRLRAAVPMPAEGRGNIRAPGWGSVEAVRYRPRMRMIRFGGRLRDVEI